MIDNELINKARKYADEKIKLDVSMYNPNAYNLVFDTYLDAYKLGQENVDSQIEELNKLVDTLRENIQALSDYAEIDVDENGEPIL